MATCACGCGRRLGALNLAAKGGSAGAEHAAEMLAYASHFDLSGLTAVEAANWQTWLDRLQQLRRWCLEHAHGTARPDVTPDLMQLQSELGDIQLRLMEGR